MNLLDILSTSPTTSVRNESRKQMRIQILIKWFKGLRTVTLTPLSSVDVTGDQSGKLKVAL